MVGQTSINLNSCHNSYNFFLELASKHHPLHSGMDDEVQKVRLSLKSQDPLTEVGMARNYSQHCNVQAKAQKKTNALFVLACTRGYLADVRLASSSLPCLTPVQCRKWHMHAGQSPARAGGRPRSHR